jgi:hypothetical protein
MAGEAQQIKTSVFMPGKGPSSRVGRQLTFEMISEWIHLQGFDEYTANGLIELASRYPTHALPSFRKNFNLMIQRVRQKRKQEQGQPVDERPAGEKPLGENPEVCEKEELDESQSSIGGDAGQSPADEVASVGSDDGLVEHA